MQTCGTNFLTAATATPGLEILVQVLERASLGGALPDAASGVTFFAPVNGAFMQMLQMLGTPEAHMPVPGCCVLFRHTTA